MSSTTKAAIAGIDEQAWRSIKYTDAIFDEDSKQWISTAEVAEVDFVAFSSQKITEQIPGRLVVRRIPDFNAAKKAAAGQDGLFDAWRFHAFFTTADPELLDTVKADTTHRGHAVIEQINADLKNSALAHLPSGIFTANAAWLVLAVMAFNLARAAATPDRDRAGQGHHRHHPPQTHHRPGPHRVIGPPDRAPPTNRLALGEGLDQPVQPDQ